MRVARAYLMDGRGQPADGRRRATPAQVVDLHDAVEDEPVDAEWSEDEAEHAAAESTDVEIIDEPANVKLSSYAAWWIRAYILRYVLQNARIVRLGTTATQRKLFFNLRKEKAKLERMGFVPTSDRVAKAMRVPEHEVIDMEQRLGAPDASLDAPVDREDDHARSRLDMIESIGVRPDTITEDG